MSLKTTLALLIVTAAVGALTWYGPFLSREIRKGQPDQGSQALLKELNSEELRRIELRQANRDTVLEKSEGGAWTLPGHWPVAAAEANALVELLVNLRSRFGPEPLRRS